MTFNRFFQILAIYLAILFGFGPQMARAQGGVPVQVIGQAPGPSSNCSGGFVPFMTGQLLIGAAQNCRGQIGVWEIVNSTTGCLALSANGSPLTTMVIEGGTPVTVGTYTDMGFRTCLPPGESAMFKGDPLGVRLTGQAFRSPRGVGSENGIRSFDRGFPIIMAASYTLGDNGALMFLPSSAGGRCGGSGRDIVLNSAGGVMTVAIQNFQCSG